MDDADELVDGDHKNDRRRPVGLRLERFVTDVEAQTRHARVAVRTVAAEAGVRHDWPDLRIL